MSVNVYEKVTNIIIEKLEQGVVPWRKPWNAANAPRNLVSKKAYRGINLLLLANLDYEQPFYLTFRQVKQLGGGVKRDEKSHLVVFYKWFELAGDDGKPVITVNGKTKTIPMLRHYHVFNLEQCNGIDPKHIPVFQTRSFNPIDTAEQIVTAMPQRPNICFGSFRACYAPMSDSVSMPARNSFISDEELYSTLFHELVHATGHNSRLDRPTIGTASFGSEDYSKEELIAEMGAAFLCAEAGIENCTIDNSAAYIGNWLTKLRNDKRLVVSAAGAAQKACDFILNKTKGKNN